jgi:hypothetical protein
MVIVIQSNLAKRERIKRAFALSGHNLQPLEPYLHTSYDGQKGFCSKRECLAVILRPA